MHAIDGAFREKREKAARVRRARRRKVFARWVGFAVFLIAIGAGLTFLPRWISPVATVTIVEEAVEAELEAETTSIAQAVYVPAILDLAGDPLLISLGVAAQAGTRLRNFTRPEDLVDTGISARLTFLSDSMLASSERFMTTLPSSPEDFAFFQAQSGRGRATEPFDDQFGLDEADQQDHLTADQTSPSDDPPVDDLPDDDPQSNFELTPVSGQNEGGEAAGILPESEIGSDYDQTEAGALPPGSDLDDSPLALPNDLAAGDSGDDSAGWGETFVDGEESLPEFSKTRIEDTTSIGFVIPEADRKPATEDFLFRVLGDRTIDSIASENGFGPTDARAIGEALKSQMNLDSLRVGDVVALRGYRSGPEQTIPMLVQVSIYRDEEYRGTLARSAKGAFANAADPWIKDDLFHYSTDANSRAPSKRYRLLDAIYSTAARSNVPSGVIGEAIQALTRGGLDLQAFAAQDDRLLLVYSNTPRDAQRNTGRVLFVGVKGRERDFQCFVYQAREGEDFGCMQEGGEDEIITVTNGMVTPVSGVLTSTFGPRMHPILRRVLVHKGVDWAAKTGTPVVAAFDGTIEFAGDAKGYGNFVRIAHAGGKATGYAHLSRFAPDAKPGTAVAAGDVIGYVGTTGRSTGPHLHFELYRDGRAVNPLANESEVAEVSDGSAVDTLVHKIIQVESGGKATAKNPLSSATGLGQFIESTWLRMMRTYRPELVRSLSREDILKLRFDPTISREMVANLARESEAKLRARGHQITAGRLYLAHFLGVDGANRVLSANGGSAIETVVDSGVVPANPFLRGMSVTDVINWAERKMSGKRARVAAAPIVTTKTISRTSPAFLRYKEAMSKFLQMTGTAL